MRVTAHDKQAGEREEMVSRLASAGLRDERVLAAMAKVPRHLFVEPALSHRAYEDSAFPLGGGQTISKPSTVGYMTELLELTGAEKALEVGTGSGYQAAVLSLLVEQLFTIERINDLSNRARKLFNRLHLSNVVPLVGDGTVGSARYAPFDVIIVTAGGPKLPEPLARQLADGGRMVAPVVEGEESRIHLVRREGDRFRATRTELCQFVPLIGRHAFPSEG